MDDLRKELLAHTALARDEHRQVRGSHTQGHLQRPVEERGGADDAEALFYGRDVCHLFVLFGL